MEISGCQGRSAQTMGEVEKPSVLGLQQCQTQFRSGQTGEEGRKIFSFRIPHGPLPSQTDRQTSPKLPGESRALGRHLGDSGNRAVLTEHGASASQMAAASFMDTISRLSCKGNAGQMRKTASVGKAKRGSRQRESIHLESAEGMERVKQRQQVSQQAA